MSSEKKVYLITSSNEAGTLETLPVTPEMELIRNETLALSDHFFHEGTKVCITSEYSMATVLNRLDPTRKKAAIVLKDKLEFRRLLHDIYPDYAFRHIKTEEIPGLKISKKSVLKPIRGIFGTAVKIVGPGTDFSKLADEIDFELEKNSRVYPDSVLSGGDFLLEDFIEGEEFAVDMFYNSNGEPCIVNIMHHPIPEHESYVHMIYNSSMWAFDAIYDKAKEFFTQLNRILNVTNFAMHSELRLQNGRIHPVEINSMRFGGMGLCNLAYYAFNVNSFLCFLNDSEPDWYSIWREHKGRIYTFFIAYNGVAINTDHYRPLPGKLTERFTSVIREQLFDYRKQLAFGIYFLEETEENIGELLKLDFNDFFKPL